MRIARSLLFASLFSLIAGSGCSSETPAQALLDGEGRPAWFAEHSPVLAYRAFAKALANDPVKLPPMPGSEEDGGVRALKHRVDEFLEPLSRTGGVLMT